MRAFGVLFGLVWGPLLVGGLPVHAQLSDPAEEVTFQPQRYRAVIGVPPAVGSRAEADDLAILRWNLRTKTP